MSTSGLGQMARRGVLWSAATFLGARLLTFVSIIVLARLLTPTDFGVVAAVLVFIAVLEVISDAGMKATVVYEQESGMSERVHTAFTVNLGVAGALCAVSVLLAPLVASFFDIEEHTNLFRVASLNLLLTGLGNVHDALLLRELNFRRRMVPEIARGIANASLAIPLAASGSGASALVAGLLAGTAAWTTAQWLLSAFRPHLSFDRSILRSMVNYGSGAFSLAVIGSATRVVPLAIVGRMLGEQALGLYTVARRVPELAIEEVVYNVSRVYFPALAKKRSLDGAVNAATLSMLRLQSLCVAPIAAGLAVLSSPLIVVLFTDKWSEAGPVLSALAVMSGLACAFFPLGDGLKAVGKQWLMVALNLIQIPFVAVGIMLLAPQGIGTVVWFMTAASLTFLVGMTLLASRELGIRRRDIVGAVRPAVVAAVGVILGAGAVRLAWPDLSAGPLLLGVAGGSAGGLACVRLFSPLALRELGDVLQLKTLWPRRAMHAQD